MLFEVLVPTWAVKVALEALNVASGLYALNLRFKPKTQEDTKDNEVAKEGEKKDAKGKEEEVAEGAASASPAANSVAQLTPTSASSALAAPAPTHLKQRLPTLLVETARQTCRSQSP